MSEPGPDVLRILFATVDLKQSRPGVSAITSVIFVGLGLSIIKKGATDSWSSSGATKSQWMVIDSMTDEVIGVAEGEYKTGFIERLNKCGSAEEAFKYRGKRIRQIADEGLASW